MVWNGKVEYGMVWYGMAWYGMAWYGMAWYGMVWYGSNLYSEQVDRPPGRLLAFGLCTLPPLGMRVSRGLDTMWRVTCYTVTCQTT